MKKVLYIFSAALLAVVAGSCSKKDIDIDTFGGKGLEFIHFENAAESWLVTGEDDSYDYNVVVACTYTYDSAVTYNVSVGEGTTGVEGKDFSIPVKSVTIAAGKYTGEVPVKVLYETTGEGFTLELVLSVDDKLINPAYGASDNILVKTDKITIDWDWLVGKWNAQDTAGDPYVMTVTQKDETTAVFTNIWGMEADMEGKVDFEARTVTFKAPIALGEVYGGVLYVAHYNAATEAADEEDIVATLSPLGITIDNLDYYLVGGPYDGYDFGYDKTVMTR